MENAIVREGKALVESFAISCTNTMLYEEIGLVEEGDCSTTTSPT